MTPSSSVPRAGVYVPAITFFDPSTDKVHYEAQAKYFTYLASTGINGLVVLGSNAETFLLSQTERKAILMLARECVPAGFPIIAGVSGHSTSQVQEYIQDAQDAGADYALVLPCAYFGKQTTPAVIKSFYADVARTSSLPIIIYNFPGVCNRLDLDSEIITQITRAANTAQQERRTTTTTTTTTTKGAPIVGVKLTCGSVAKITRLAATFTPQEFTIFGGQADFLVGGLAAGSQGCITAFGNIFPKTVVRIYDLWTTGRTQEAYVLQQKAALAESPTKAGIANTKYAAAVFSGKRAGIRNAVALARPRLPYPAPAEDVQTWIRETMQGLEAEEYTDASSSSESHTSSPDSAQNDTGRQVQVQVQARL